MSDSWNGLRRRVAMVGPVVPFRGGISQHTTFLHRELSKRTDCLTLSFLRQYPKFLFPGSSEVDEKSIGHREAGVEYSIDSLNPVTWSRAVERIARHAADLVVFPWWHVYWSPSFFWMTSKINKLLPSADILFICHNSMDHEQAYWKRLFVRGALSNASWFICHNPEDRSNLKKWFPEKPVLSRALPIFSFPEPTNNLLKRKSLELLFFGFVRPYKGLSTLLEAMALLKGQDVQLTVVGEFWSGASETEEFVRKHDLGGQIELVSRYVSDAEASEYFSRCDIVVLPYHSATGSAVLSSAFYFNKPVLATRVGGIPDVVTDGETGLLVEPRDSSALAHAISRIQRGEVHFSPLRLSEVKAALSWEGYASAVLQGPSA